MFSGIHLWKEVVQLVESGFLIGVQGRKVEHQGVERCAFGRHHGIEWVVGDAEHCLFEERGFISLSYGIQQHEGTHFFFSLHL